jgi:lipopolysaccharide/colanic/teichoic acid biosynthesis glycosyltransferase
MRSHLVERAVEIPTCLLALIFFAPAMLLIAIAVRCDGGPAIYRQRRVGRGGKRFSSLKFRSMSIDADARLKALLETDSRSRREWKTHHRLVWDPRVTWIGDHLRKSAMDELPQLINVLRGDMSFVGPRPIVEAEIIRYGRRFADYCSLRPGLTGLWQLRKGPSISYRRRIAMDVYYRRNRRPSFYFGILAASFLGVIFKR